jgi:hypothetical protein
MTRKQAPAGVVRIICTNSYHHDTGEFRQYGHHCLRTLRLGYGQWDLSEGFTSRGQRPRAPGVQGTDPDGKPVLIYMGIRPGQPVKKFPQTDPGLTYKFKCSCGRKRERHESYLMDLVWRHLEADPGATRIDIDITTL